MAHSDQKKFFRHFSISKNFFGSPSAPSNSGRSRRTEKISIRISDSILISSRSCFMKFSVRPSLGPQKGKKRFFGHFRTFFGLFRSLGKVRFWIRRRIPIRLFEPMLKMVSHAKIGEKMVSLPPRNAISPKTGHCAASYSRTEAKFKKAAS